MCADGGLSEQTRRCKESQIVVAERYITSCLVRTLLALEYVHERKVFHGDLKPANILVSGKGEVKVGELGICEAADPNDKDVKGTLPYIPPEVYEQEPATLKGDPGQSDAFFSK